LKTEGKRALIPYLMAGDPHPDQTLAQMQALVRGGADIIELGVPFSDPMADGPVIQRAAERALAQGMGMQKVLDLVKAFRIDNNSTPIVLMGYLNPIEIMGYEAFVDQAASAGVDAVLTVDLPPEEAADFIALLQARDVDPIFLVAPTSDAGRIERICALASGFVYYVSVKGVTGAAHLDTQAVATKIAEIREMTELPVGVGFGIKDAATAGTMAQLADAVVVGSAIVSRIETLGDNPQALASSLTGFLSELRQAIDAVSVSSK
jgi:tryptophan synthase alpha chain